MAIFQLYKARKSFEKKEVLMNVSFTCETGEILGIFGRNGCGKSTLLKLIFGTLKADEIEMSIDGITLKASEVILKKRIAYLPQHCFLPKNLRVRDCIPIYYQSQEKQDAIFYDTLIRDISSLRVGELSLGQLRYLQVLLIGNLDREFIFFDEPFSMIDPLYKDKISEFIEHLKDRKGIIITDHYYMDVLNISTKNLLIKEAKSYTINSKEDLRNMNYLN